MSAIPEPVERYRELLDSAAPRLPARQTDWLAAQRALAAKHFIAEGFPTRRNEAWRYTSLDRVLDQPWEIPTAPFSALMDLDIEEFRLVEEAAALLVFANGRWVPELSDTRALASTLRVGSLRAALEEEPARLAQRLGQAAPPVASSFAALNTALIDDGLFVHIPADVKLTRPIEVLHLAIGQDEPPLLQPRNLVVLEEGAEAVLIEHHASLGDAAYFSNGLTEVLLGEHARLEHARLQDEGPAARHIGQVFVRQGGHSLYQGIAVSLGGLWSRTEYHNAMCEEHARCELDGLYVAGDGQLTDVHLDIDHAVPHCSSRERFKGILLGRGRAVFDGRIRVAVDAQQTDAQLANDNLMLSRDAEVDTKPQLEIYADDVKCSHGTTIGQLEPAQLFYLRSRGISAEDARRMLCLGFATEVLAGCSAEGFRTRVERRLQLLLSDEAKEHTTGGETHV